MSPQEIPSAGQWSDLESRARAAFSKFDELRGFL
jgi:hypothetical protein